MENPAAVVGETRCGPEYADNQERPAYRQMRSSSFWAMSGAD